MQHSSLIRNSLLVVLCGGLCAGGATGATTTPKKKPTASSASSSKSTSHKKRTKARGKASKNRGQKAIESERAQQIQEALIREHYMSGQPSGKWDDGTQAALRRYQADQGWQSKSVPDSRALIKLGLGPNHHLLNPETAMTTAPPVPKATKPPNADAPAATTPAPNGVPQN
jgi:Putative peptidoglycan binding domain